MKKESSQIKCLSEAKIPTEIGNFMMKAYSREETTKMPHIALLSDTFSQEVTNVRIHSECITGDLFGSLRCDCGEQLMASLQYIQEHGGVLIYLRQEGRGIGIINKLRAYQLQDQGMNTAEANVHLGFEVDERDYVDALDILRLEGISRIHLLTNNPDKLSAFEDSDLEIVKRIPLIIPPREENLSYFETKKKLMGHLF